MVASFYCCILVGRQENLAGTRARQVTGRGILKLEIVAVAPSAFLAMVHRQDFIGQVQHQVLPTRSPLLLHVDGFELEGQFVTEGAI